MPSQSSIYVARAIAGFLLLSHIVGMLWYGSALSGLWIMYGALVVSSLSVFCLLPRPWLHRVRFPVIGLAAAAICATFAIAYEDITLINGADYGALGFRGILVGILIVMLWEAMSRRNGS